jgi:alcohol dehydrogenase class IV
MHNAQCLAERTFSNALLGMVHSMDHKTGAAYSGGHIVHSAANSMYLHKVITYNAKETDAAQRYAEIARFIGLLASSLVEGTDSLIKHIRILNDNLDIPQCINH